MCFVLRILSDAFHFHRGLSVKEKQVALIGSTKNNSKIPVANSQQYGASQQCAVSRESTDFFPSSIMK